MKRMLCGMIALLSASMLICGCEMPQTMKEDLAYIKEHAGQISNLLRGFGEKIAEDPDGFFGGDGETEESNHFLEPLLEKTWTLCAFEDEYGYNDQIFEDEEKRFLLVDEWIELQFPLHNSKDADTGEVYIRYKYGNNKHETHSYQYTHSDEGLYLSYLFPDYDQYGSDEAEYNKLLQMDPDSEEWPFMLPLQDEWWTLLYDETRGMIKIERTKKGEDAPYMSWYLSGTSWYQ